MMQKTQDSSHSVAGEQVLKDVRAIADDVLKFKKRMLEWPNPVEYVNNMYGCHPEDNDGEYFRVVFSK